MDDSTIQAPNKWTARLEQTGKLMLSPKELLLFLLNSQNIDYKEFTQKYLHSEEDPLKAPFKEARAAMEKGATNESGAFDLNDAKKIGALFNDRLFSMPEFWGFATYTIYKGDELPKIQINTPGIQTRTPEIVAPEIDEEKTEENTPTILYREEKSSRNFIPHTCQEWAQLVKSGKKIRLSAAQFLPYVLVQNKVKIGSFSKNDLNQKSNTLALNFKNHCDPNNEHYFNTSLNNTRGLSWDLIGQILPFFKPPYNQAQLWTDTIYEIDSLTRIPQIDLLKIDPRSLYTGDVKKQSADAISKPAVAPDKRQQERIEKKNADTIPKFPVIVNKRQLFALAVEHAGISASDFSTVIKNGDRRFIHQCATIHTGKDMGFGATMAPTISVLFNPPFQEADFWKKGSITIKTAADIPTFNTEKLPPEFAEAVLARQEQDKIDNDKKALLKAEEAEAEKNVKVTKQTVLRTELTTLTTLGAAPNPQNRQSQDTQSSTSIEPSHKDGRYKAWTAQLTNGNQLHLDYKEYITLTLLHNGIAPDAATARTLGLDEGFFETASLNENPNENGRTNIPFNDEQAATLAALFSNEPGFWQKETPVKVHRLSNIPQISIHQEKQEEQLRPPVADAIPKTPETGEENSSRASPNANAVQTEGLINNGVTATKPGNYRYIVTK